MSVLMTGTLIWFKGHEYALQALALARRETPIQLRIIGSGPEMQRARYTARDLGIDHAVQMLGSCSPARVRDELRAADAFLLSSLSEGISNAVLEAMACGLPVVTTDCGGMPEVVRDGVEGRVVPVRDVQAMATALVELAREPERRRAMGAAARQRVLEAFDLARQADAFAKLYRRLGSRRRSEVAS